MGSGRAAKPAPLNIRSTADTTATRASLIQETPAEKSGETFSFWTAIRSLFLGSVWGRLSSPTINFVDQPITLEQKNRFRDIQQMFNKSLYDACSDHIALKLRWVSDGDAIPRLCIIVSCKDKQARERATKFFRQSHVCEEIEKDFPVHMILGLRLLHGDAIRVYGDLLSVAQLNGTPLRIDVENESKAATLGGLLSVKAKGLETIYSFTAGHSLSRGEASGEVDPRLLARPEPNTYIGRVTHHIFEKRFASSINNYDWALIHLADVDQSSIEAWTGPSRAGLPESSQLDTPCLSVAEPDWALHTDGIVGYAMTSRGKCGGRLVSNASCIRIAPSSQAVEALDFIPESNRNSTFGEQGRPRVVLGPGDSGCWVVREDDGAICGHVVSIDAFGECYVLPFHQVLQDIRSKLNADAVGLYPYQTWPRATENDRDATRKGKHTTWVDSEDIPMKSRGTIINQGVGGFGWR